MFLKISQNSHENTCARVSFLIKLRTSGQRPATLWKKRLWYKCFTVYTVKFLRTTFIVGSSTPSERGVRIFQKLTEMAGEVPIIFARKWVKAKWGSLSRNGWGICHVTLRFFWRFLVIQHMKSWYVYLSFVNEHVLQNNWVNKIRDDWHCNSFNSVDSYNSCVNYLAWCELN